MSLIRNQVLFTLVVAATVAVAAMVKVAAAVWVACSTPLLFSSSVAVALPLVAKVVWPSTVSFPSSEGWTPATWNT